MATGRSSFQLVAVVGIMYTQHVYCIVHSQTVISCAFGYRPLFSYLLSHIHRTDKFHLPRVLHLSPASIVFLLSHHPKFGCVVIAFLCRVLILGWFESELCV